MRKLLIQGNQHRHEFGIHHIKWLIGNNPFIKHDLMMSLRRLAQKDTLSEYAEEHTLIRNVWLDENVLNSRNTIFYEITPTFDLEEQTKLKINTLLYDFLLTVLNDFDMTDELQTIHTLFWSLTDSLEESINEGDSSLKISTSFQDLNPKTILKLMNVDFIKEDLAIRTLDTSVREIIELQFILLKRMAKIKPEVDFIILLNLENGMPSLNVDDVTENVLVIAPYKPNTKVEIEDVYLLVDKGYDLSDRHDVYERITLNHPAAVNLEETYQFLENFVNEPMNEPDLIPK